jgi:hypothetical protein
MKKIVALKLEGGASLLVEADDFDALEQEDTTRSRAGTRFSEKTLEEALETAKSISDSVIRKLKTVQAAPDKIEASFGLKISSKLDAILASGEAEANITFTLTWERGEQAGRPR